MSKDKFIVDYYVNGTRKYYSRGFNLIEENVNNKEIIKRLKEGLTVEDLDKYQDSTIVIDGAEDKLTLFAAQEAYALLAEKRRREQLEKDLIEINEIVKEL